MSAPRELLQQLLERRDLSQSQAEELLTHLTDPQLPPALAATARSGAACARKLPRSRGPSGVRMLSG